MESFFVLFKYCLILSLFSTSPFFWGGGGVNLFLQYFWTLPHPMCVWHLSHFSQIQLDKHFLYFYMNMYIVMCYVVICVFDTYMWCVAHAMCVMHYVSAVFCVCYMRVMCSVCFVDVAWGLRAVFVCRQRRRGKRKLCSAVLMMLMTPSSTSLTLTNWQQGTVTWFSKQATYISAKSWKSAKAKKKKKKGEEEGENRSLVFFFFSPRDMITNACVVGLVHQARRAEEEVAPSYAQLSFSHGTGICNRKIFLDQSFEPRHARWRRWAENPDSKDWFQRQV